ncbi:protein argonaute-1-like isoform X2 [Panulirus ornatus]
MVEEFITREELPVVDAWSLLEHEGRGRDLYLAKSMLSTYASSSSSEECSPAEDWNTRVPSSVRWSSVDQLMPVGKISEGTLGSPILLTTNCYSVLLGDPDVTLVTYRQTITDANEELRLPYSIRIKITERLQKYHPQVLGKLPIVCGSEHVAYTVGIIPEMQDMKFKAKYRDKRGRISYDVRMERKSQARVKDLYEACCRSPSLLPPPDLIMVLKAIFKNHLSFRCKWQNNSYVPRCRREHLAEQDNISHNLECHHGFLVDVHHFAGRQSPLCLSINLKTSVVTREQPLLCYLRNDVRTRDIVNEKKMQSLLETDDVVFLTSLLTNLKVKSIHSEFNRVYRIVRVSCWGSNCLTFRMKNRRTTTEGEEHELDEGKTVWTVEQYFKEFYSCNLFYPKLNCVQVASRTEPIYLPMEVCMLLKDQDMGNKLSKEEREKVNNTTVVSPRDWSSHLSTIVQDCDFDSSPALKAMKCTVSRKPLGVRARVLPAPYLTTGQILQPKDGTWDAEDLTLCRPIHLKTWTVFMYDVRGVSGAKSNKFYKPFLMRLIEVGRKMGMRIDEPRIDVIRKSPEPQMEFELLASYYPDTQIVLVFLKPDAELLYERLKVFANTEVEILTQCIRPETYRENASEEVLRNLVLQLNAKCGGTNVNLHWDSMPSLAGLAPPRVLLLGAAIDHPPRYGHRTPSIAAVVGVTDIQEARYTTRVRPQPHNHEILELKQMVRDIMAEDFKKNLGTLPRQMIVYRLGVQEDFLQPVLEKELRQIWEAFKLVLPQGYPEPTITYIALNKAKSIRFFCSDRGDGDEESSVPPGTVVEKYITHPTQRDFYLCSHLGKCGTSKIVHYTVLWDENNLSMDQLQTYTYALCHLDARGSHSVSLPMPAMYAQLAAKMSRTQIATCERDHMKQPIENPLPDVNRHCIMGGQNKVLSKLYFL